MAFRSKTLILAFGIGLFADVALGETLPIPKGLERDVDFWEKIFNVYGSNHCVIHDSRRLDAIFIVKEIPDGSASRRSRAIREFKEEVEEVLGYLGRGGKPHTALHRRVIQGTPRELRKPSYWRSAAENLRCQQGVDIGHSLARSQRYLPMIRRIFRQKGLPDDLAYLPHLESGFHRTATSKANARGLWQFLPSMARHYGLRVSAWRDERVDPTKATVAAAKHLAFLKKAHKEWPLAITAYNYGTNGMRRAIAKYGHDYMKIRRHHRTKIFGFAVKNYYPSFLAVRNVARRFERGMSVADEGSSRGRISF